jgi:hypothetical protein
MTALFIGMLGLASAAQAQQLPDAKKWELSASAAVFEVRPGEETPSYGDDWYFSGRYAVAVGRYWTAHLKTEVEYAISGEGSNYLERFSQVPGNPGPLPYSVESIHRVEQGSARMVWQFGDNAWVHPYVSGGLVVDRDRQRLRVPPIYQYPTGRTSGPMILTREETTAPTTTYRAGVTAGAGAKIYMNENAFFNTGVIATYAKPASTISLLAGFGIDF